MSSRAQNREVGNIHFTKEHMPSPFSLAFQGDRRLHFAISIQRILSLPLHPKHFLSTLGKLHVQLISYLVGSPGWSLMRLSSRS